MTSAILMLVATGIFWCFIGFVAGEAPKRKFDMQIVIAFNSLILSIAGFAYVFTCESATLSGTPMIFHLCFLASGVVASFTLTCLSKGMQVGPNGIVWSAQQCGCFVPFIVGAMFFDFHASACCKLGFFAAIVSVLLIGFCQDRNATEQKKHLQGWQIYAFAVFALNGIANVLVTVPSYYPEMGLSSICRTSLFFAGSGVMMFIVLLFRSGRKLQLAVREHCSKGYFWFLLLGLSLTNMISYFYLFYPGVDKLTKANMGAIATPLCVGSMIVFFELYCIFRLHEHRTKLQVFILILCLLATAALAF